MARDNFTSNVIDILAKRVGVRCSNPSCGQITAGPRSDPSQSVNIGVAAHITAASEGGPRFDQNLTSEQRQSITNGIWLCQNCAKLVDNDPVRYTVELLQRWRKQAERSAQESIEGGASRTSPVENAEVHLNWKTRYQSTDRHDYELFVHVMNKSEDAISAYHLDLVFPRLVMHQPHNYAMYVAGRSNNDTVVLRADSERDFRGDKIYPGDSKLVMTLEYSITSDIFENHGGVFSHPVQATLYQPGARSIIVERCFEEFQNF